jgi:hypothetical protein
MKKTSLMLFVILLGAGLLGGSTPRQVSAQPEIPTGKLVNAIRLLNTLRLLTTTRMGATLTETKCWPFYGRKAFWANHLLTLRIQLRSGRILYSTVDWA